MIQFSFRGAQRRGIPIFLRNLREQSLKIFDTKGIPPLRVGMTRNRLFPQTTEAMRYSLSCTVFKQKDSLVTMHSPNNRLRKREPRYVITAADILVCLLLAADLYDVYFGTQTLFVLYSSYMIWLDPCLSKML